MFTELRDMAPVKCQWSLVGSRVIRKTDLGLQPEGLAAKDVRRAARDVGEGLSEMMRSNGKKRLCDRTLTRNAVVGLQ